MHKQIRAVNEKDDVLSFGTTRFENPAESVSRPLVAVDQRPVLFNRDALGETDQQIAIDFKKKTLVLSYQSPDAGAARTAETASFSAIASEGGTKTWLSGRSSNVWHALVEKLGKHYPRPITDVLDRLIAQHEEIAKMHTTYIDKKA